MDSQLYELEQQEDNNRRLVAKQKIEQKKLIVSQTPLVMFTFQESRGVICDQCLGGLVEVFKCPLCNSKYYCSLPCLTKDKQNHNSEECQAIQNIQKDNHRANTLFFMTLRVFILVANKFMDKTKFDTFINHYQTLSEDKKQFVNEMGSMILKYLVKLNSSKYQVNQENQLFLQELICKIMCNSFTIEDELSQQKQALVVYSNVNYINHSCEPNSIQIFKNSKIQIYSLREIKEKEEISISYVDLLYNKQQRKAFLKENYLFDCECGKCRRQTLQQEIKCECNQQIICETQLECKQCNRNYSSEQFNHILNTCVEYRDYILNKNVENDQIIDQKLKKYEFIFKNLPSKNYYHAQALQYLTQLSIIIDSLDLLSCEKFEIACKYLIRLVTVLEKLVSVNSPMLGWKYCEVAKLSFYLKKEQRSQTYSEKALDVLQTYYDDNNQQMRELKERYSYIIQIMESRKQITN